ncbi:DegT/DnrJ/EryC1/StrS family aminotransferase [Saccharothrix sp. HUAS TT1]|uniref:DegT/DnrJ/EryC1/StrS family aminotransferase n=1 Tax=unclassified Saccharothrix TaxID=2593673 RepID=UPI00345BA4F0
MRPWLGAEEAEAASAAVLAGRVAQGPEVAAFEDAFARRVAALHAVATSSCTTALHLALHLLGVRPGDEVVVPSLSFIATANAVRQCGATPVFADVEPETGNLAAATVEPVLTDRTRAVVPVHQAGVPVDVDPIRALCRPLGVAVVEDAACAAGSTYRGVPVGADAEVAVWSFHPRKPITTGEGGMLTTNREEWAARARRLREHGTSVSAAERHSCGGSVAESYLEPAFNYRMTDVQAAVGLVQLSKLDAIVRRRRELAARYHELLADGWGAGVPGSRAVRDPEHGTTNYQSFWVVLPDDAPVTRDEVLVRLAERGVSARRGIMAAHLEPAYADHPRVDLPVTESFTRRSLILPLYHDMTTAEQDTVVDELGAALWELPASL